MDLLWPFEIAWKNGCDDPFNLRQSAGLRCGLVGLMRADIDRDGFVELGVGPECFVIPVLDGKHLCHGRACAPNPVSIIDLSRAVDLVDLCFWDARRNRRGLLVGNVIALGEAALNTAEVCDSLEIWDTPAAWMAHDECGIVPLDLEACAWRLLEFKSLVCETVELGERVQAAVAAVRQAQMPPDPLIMVAG